MKYITYFVSWCATVFGVSFYLNWYWNIFFLTYYQKMDVLTYGFNPKGMPPFNWKVELLLWISGILLFAVMLGLIMDGVCKSHFKKGAGVLYFAIVLNQTAAAALYAAFGYFSGYMEAFYYMPRFLFKIICDAFSLSAGDDLLFVVCLFHGALLSAISMVFYTGEYRRQSYIKEREREYADEKRAESEEPLGKTTI